MHEYLSWFSQFSKYLPFLNEVSYVHNWKIYIFKINKIDSSEYGKKLNRRNYLPGFAHCNNSVKVCVYGTKKMIGRTLHNWARKSSI